MKKPPKTGKKAARRVRSADPFAAILAQAPVIIFGLDPQGRFTFSTGRGLASLGLASGEVVGRSALEMYWDVPAVTADLRRALKGEDFSSVVQVGALWFETFYHPVFTAAGALKSVVGLAFDVTARQRVEAELIQSERRFRTVIDTMQEGFYLTDAQGRRLFVNKALARIYGGEKPADLLGKSFLDRVVPEMREEVWKRFLESMRTGAFPRRVEVGFLRDDGSRGTMELDPSPVYEDGRLVGACGVVRDITERKQTEAQIRSAQEMLQLVLDNIPQRVFWKDLQSVYVGCNRPFAKDCGYESPAEIVGKDDFATASSANAERYRTDDRQVMESGQPKLNFEEPQIRANGSRRVLRTNKVPLRDPDGKVIGVLGTYEDITERRDAERALRMMHFAMEHTSDAVMWVCAEGAIRYANPAACRQLGYGGDEILKLTIADLDPDYRIEDRPAQWRRIQQDGYLHFEARHRAKDGRIFPVEVSVNHVRFEGEEFSVSFTRDISERKQAEAERARLLEFEQEARAEAEAASRAKDEFLAIVSHELRTPMTAILGWNWLLRSGDLSPRERERALEVIERNMQLQKQIIEDLLDISSLARKQLTLRRQVVDLGGMVAQAAAEFKSAAAAKSLRLLCEPVLGLSVDADPQRLRQIFWNLISNAVKFTPDGGAVTVRLRRGSGAAEVSVEDSGPGISPEFYPHLFSMFQQQEESLTRVHRGLGLGLAIVKHLVELHGGTITVAPPVPGRGARLTVSLPLAAQPRPGGASQAEGPDSAPHIPRLLQGVRVLVVEDDDDTRGMLLSALAHCGASVRGAASAAEGFSLFSQDRPHVLISDIAMPDEDGYSLLRRIRALKPEEGGKVPAAALTAYATSEDRTKALRAGFQIYLPKPVDPAELVTVVRTLAGKSGVPGKPRRD
ncbi:MAG: PAS domain S-box protein [Elusimicrobia bacterium]|nr:PAS domain S-box protein [Elusimicrobiota bacterium]